jgi:hypothetical protein
MISRTISCLQASVYWAGTALVTSERLSLSNSYWPRDVRCPCYARHFSCQPLGLRSIRKRKIRSQCAASPPS